MALPLQVAGFAYAATVIASLHQQQGNTIRVFTYSFIHYIPYVVAAPLFNGNAFFNGFTITC